MARGLPDYSVYPDATTLFPVTDLGELAARLGSPIVHDRGGNVLWFDDFECGLNKWVEAGAGVGKDLELSRDRSRFGRHSALLTAGNAGSARGTMARRHPFQQIVPMGLEFAFSLVNDVETVRLEFDVSNPVASAIFGFRWNDGAGNVFQFLNDVGTYVTVGTAADLDKEATFFHVIKLIVDPVNARYIAAIVNEQRIVFSDPAQVKPAAVLPQVSMRVNVDGRVGFSDQMFVDSVILTQNEPAP